MHEDMSALQSGVDLTARIGELFASWQQGQQRGMSPALYLELIAEATREPQIAEAVGRWHCVGTAEFNAWLKQVAKADGLTLTDEEVRQKAFAVSCFIDGLAIRAVREPGLDPAFVAESVRTFLPRLLASQKKPVGNE